MYEVVVFSTQALNWRDICENVEWLYKQASISHVKSNNILPTDSALDQTTLLDFSCICKPCHSGRGLYVIHNNEINSLNSAILF